MLTGQPPESQTQPTCTAPAGSAHGRNPRRPRRTCGTADARVASNPSPIGRPASPKITIVLAEHQHLVRGGIRCLLEREAEFDVVGEATDGLRVVDLVERLKPRPHNDIIRAKKDSLCQKRDAHSPRIDKSQVRRSFPSPQKHLRLPIQARGGCVGSMIRE